jgi:hypothetical protein
LPAVTARNPREGTMSEETPLAETPVEVDLTTKIEDAPTETVETVEKAAETPPETEAAEPTETTEETTDETEPKKNIPGSQRLKRRLELISSEANQLLEKNAELERRIQSMTQTAPQGRPGVEREPTEADFPNDYFAFQEAKTAWTVRQSVRDEINRDRQSRQQSVEAESVRERLLAHEESAELARERIPDFDKVVRAATDVAVKQEVAEELLASEKSALLQYHLAKNPEKLRELNGMTGRELAREIGRLEARVHLPTPKKATEATPPPKEIKGTSAPQFDPQSGPDDMNAYVAWRRKQG